MGKTGARRSLAEKSGSKERYSFESSLVTLSHLEAQGHSHNPVLRKQARPGLAESRTQLLCPRSVLGGTGCSFLCSPGRTPAHRAWPQQRGARQIPRLMGVQTWEICQLQQRQTFSLGSEISLRGPIWSPAGRMLEAQGQG